jgi:Lipocalin-like domain
MKAIVIVILFMVLVNACKKKIEPAPIDKIDLITNGNSKKWRLVEITSNGKSIIENCAKDDDYTFIKNSYTVNYTPNLKCYNSDNPTNLKYSISNDQKTLTIDNVKYDFDFLNAKKMILSHGEMNETARISTTESATGTLHQQQTLTLTSN